MSNYKQPVNVPTPASSGYPNNVPNTQTKPMRGTGAATTGNKYSKNSQ